jgi:long-chain acyl-CoA synthetase
METAITALNTRDGLALDAQTLCEAFQQTAERYAGRVALRTPGGAFEITWSEYAQRVRGLSGGLAARGIGRGDTVGLMLCNRPEALIVDSAALHLGAIPFSIYNTSAPEQIEYLLGHAECKVLVTEAQFADRVLAVGERLPALEEMFVVDEAPQGIRPLTDLEVGGQNGFDFERAWRAVTGGDVATLIYTSGTTGPPKAVELTHKNLLWQLRLLDRVFPLKSEGRGMSYLPMAHLVDRATHYSSMITGASVTCVSDVREAVAALPDVRPTAWGAVPRIWEKLKAALEARGITDPGALPESMRAALRAQLGLDEADPLMSGAAPIAPEVLEFFAALGLPICEAWGMTEAAVIIAANPRDAIRIGAVGKPLPGIEVTLADDGELLVRGPTVMRGYRKDPVKTAEAIDTEGWLHTGDIGEIDPDGYVKIVDRKKELIINAAGKNMSPANIENKLKAACPLIGIAVAIGDRRPYNTALIVLDPDAAAAFAAAHDLSDARPAALAAEPAVQDEILAGIERANAKLSRVEQIKRHEILPHDWEPGGQELTPTMKLKRKPIAQKYAAAIDAMYADTECSRSDRL